MNRISRIVGVVLFSLVVTMTTPALAQVNDTVHDAEIDGMIAQVMRQTDRDKINALMRNIYTRLRSERYGVPVAYVHSPYATSKTLGKWNPGSVMYDLFIDQLAAGK